MTKKPVRRLGDLQLKILQVLWERGDAAVADVHQALGESRLAYTTVATMLRKMEARGLVKHRTDDRRFLYRAGVAADEVARTMVDDVLDRVFEGSLSDMVSHLLNTRQVDPDELKRMEEMLARHRKREKP